MRGGTMTRSGSFHFPASRQSAIWIAVLAVVRVGGVVPTAVAGRPPHPPRSPRSRLITPGKWPTASAIFSRHVRPLLVARCLKCHGGEAEVQSGFNLATREGLLAGGTNGKAVIPGNAQRSRLYRLITHARRALHAAGRRQAIHGRNRTDRRLDRSRSPLRRGTAADGQAERIVDRAKVDPKARNFWSFQPLKITRPPVEAAESWSLNPIDAFIKQSLDRHKLTPNAEASPRALVRRVTFDLIGLPPTAAETRRVRGESIASSVRCSGRSAAREPALRRPLGAALARPVPLRREPRLRARLRSADCVSLSRFRDPGVQRRPALRHVHPLAIGRRRAGPARQPGSDGDRLSGAGVHSTQITKNEVEKQRYDELDDMLATTGNAILGLSVGCARCHDHKFDPIPQADYYRLLSAFTTTVRTEVMLPAEPGHSQRLKAADRQRRSAGGSPAYARRRLLQADLFPRARRCEPEERRGAARLPAGADALAGPRETLARASRPRARGRRIAARRWPIGSPTRRKEPGSSSRG